MVKNKTLATKVLFSPVLSELRKFVTESSKTEKNNFIFQIVRQRKAAKINLSIIQNVDVYVICKYDNFALFIVKYVTVTGR